jgi:dTDP-4-dehydrorhamnose reductase
MASGPVLVIGRSGQVARAMIDVAARSPLAYRFSDRSEADLCRPDMLETLAASVKPRMIINAAAYTAVDQAEAEPELAYVTNAEGPRILAASCRRLGIPLLHLSTDYVFDGEKRSPYLPEDRTNPASVYGASKAAGEAAIRATLPEHLIVRLAWVYSEAGRNFLTTILRLGESRSELRIVNDQVGAPSYAADIAWAIDLIVRDVLSREEHGRWGTHHLTNAGQTTWYNFAKESFRLAHRFGHRVPKLVPIATSEYPTAARRPAYSVLDTTATSQGFTVTMPPWQDALERCVSSMYLRTKAAP